MKQKFRVYLICVLFVVGFIACGGDSDDDKAQQPTQPSAEPSTSSGGDQVIQLEVDFEAEDAAIREVFTLYSEAIGTEDSKIFMAYWLKSESDDVFVTWDFWAGAFAKHIGWKTIEQAWLGIFQLRTGKMTVDIESLAIDKIGKTATLRGRYQWAVSGGLIALMKKDREEGWKVKQVDYTDGKFGKQVDELADPGYVNPPPEDEQK